MTTTPNLALPYLAAAQAQKHVTHNEALRALDALVQIAVTDRTRTAPPADPVEGARHIVADGATDLWAGQSGSIAAYQDGAWAFYAPGPGWLAWIVEEATLSVFDGTEWITAASTLTSLPRLAVNTSPDAVNQLAVKGASSLFDNAGAGHRIVVNKAAAGETAAMLFQTAYGGRAELGTTGDEDLHVKVSADGTAWRDALVIDSQTADATFAGMVASPLDIQARRFLAVSPDFEYLITSIDNTHPAANSSLFEFRFGGQRRYAFGVAHANTLFTVTAYDETGAWAGSVLSIEYANAATGNMHNALYVRANRDVGIGKVPAAKLDVDGPVKIRSYTKATVPSASVLGAGAIIYVTDASGGPQLACSNGTSWLKVSDNLAI